MHKTRMEAFSDGVIAIIITIMVLELKVPHSAELEALQKLGPVFLSYVLSFIYIGIYWNNHHHLMHAAQKVTGAVLWANMHLLFWLSLIPFSTAWMGENDFARWPVLLYGINLLMCALAYTILTVALIKSHGPQSQMAKALGKDIKGKLSLCLYIFGITVSLFSLMSWISYVCYIGVALIWLVPDRRIEKTISQTS
jgi:uncharacterized membrane protein